MSNSDNPNTLNLSFSFLSAAVLCDPLIRTYRKSYPVRLSHRGLNFIFLFLTQVINYARPLIYSTVLPTYAVEAIHCALRHLSHPSTMARQSHLHALAQHVRRTLQLPPSESPIIPYLCSQSRDLAQHIQQAGFMVRPIVWPTVEKGQDRIRICLHAGNTQDEVDGLLHELRSWNRQSKL